MKELKSISLTNKENELLNAKEFFEQIGDPYSFTVDGLIVHVKFGGSSAKSLQYHINNLVLKEYDRADIINL